MAQVSTGSDYNNLTFNLHTVPVFRRLRQKLSSKVLLWIRIRIESGFNDFADPD
jgi:hypothetical protein